MCAVRVAAEIEQSDSLCPLNGRLPIADLKQSSLLLLHLVDQITRILKAITHLVTFCYLLIQ